MRNPCPPAGRLGKTLIEGVGNYLIAAGPQVGNSVIVSTITESDRILGHSTAGSAASLPITGG